MVPGEIKVQEGNIKYNEGKEAIKNTSCKYWR